MVDGASPGPTLPGSLPEGMGGKSRPSRAMTTSVRMLASIAATLLAAEASAWGGYGHSVVATIAEQRLSPAARGKVAVLLDGASMADVASWADSVRRDRKETAPLHYINFAPEAAAPTAEEVANPEGNIYVGIVGYSERLADASLPLADRAEALRFLVHFVGDVHQPLHCGMGTDLGGNRVRVQFRDGNWNLHSIWDSGLFSTREVQEADLVETLTSGAGAAEMARIGATLDPHDWIRESRAIVMERVYDLPEAEAEGQPPITDEYVAANLPIADRRLLAAGVRLAVLLDCILTNGRSPLPPPPVAFPMEPKDNLGPGPIWREGQSEGEAKPADE